MELIELGERAAVEQFHNGRLDPCLADGQDPGGGAAEIRVERGNRVDLARQVPEPDGNPDHDPQAYRQPIIMGHELLHALHFHQGEVDTRRKAEGRDEGMLLEELRTTGLEGYAQEPISENKLRSEWNELHPEDPIPQRQGYRYPLASDVEASVFRRDAEIAKLERRAKASEGLAEEKLATAAELIAEGVSPKDPRVTSRLERAAELQEDAQWARERIAELEAQLENVDSQMQANATGQTTLESRIAELQTSMAEV